MIVELLIVLAFMYILWLQFGGPPEKLVGPEPSKNVVDGWDSKDIYSIKDMDKKQDFSDVFRGDTGWRNLI